MSVEGINSTPQTQQTYVDPSLMPTEENLQKIVEEVVALFGTESSVIVEERPDNGNVHGKGNKKVIEVPELDEEEIKLLEGIAADLEALIALLTAEQDEETIAATKKRIESLKAQLEAHHNYTMGKVKESMAEMKKQEKAALANKILGWLGVVASVFMAVAMVLTVGGAAAGLAVAGAVLGVAMQTLSETGAMEKLTKAISDSIKEDHPDWSRESCDALAQGVVAGIGFVMSIGLLIGGNYASAGTGLINVTEATMKTVRTAMLVTGLITQGANLITSGVSTGINYSAQKKNAEVTETQELLLKLQTLLEQENADLEQIIQALNDAFDTVIELLESKQDTLNDISANIGA